MVKSRYNVGYDHQIYFYRDQHQHEVDFIFQSGHTLVGERSDGYLIYSGAKMQSVNNFAVLNYQEARVCVETN